MRNSGRFQRQPRLRLSTERNMYKLRSGSFRDFRPPVVARRRRRAGVPTVNVRAA